MTVLYKDGHFRSCSYDDVKRVEMTKDKRFYVVVFIDEKRKNEIIPVNSFIASLEL